MKRVAPVRGGAFLFLLCVAPAWLVPACSPPGAAETEARAAAQAAPEPVPPLAGTPRRIVPANVAAAEYVCPLVGPERIAALPEQIGEFSRLEVGAGPWAALPRFDRYYAEPIVALEPDLVVSFAWQRTDTTEFLRSRSIPVLVLRSTESYADVTATLALCGRVLGAEEAAAREIAALDLRVAELSASAPRRAGLRVLVYANTGTGGWSPGARTTSDTMIRLAGMINAAAEAGLERHAKVDFERFLAIDPDVIVVNELATGEESATKGVVANAPALAGLRAVQDDRILVLPPDLMAADSPLIVAAAERLAAEVDRMVAAGLAPR